MTPGDIVKAEADQKIAKELESGLNSIFDCSFEMSCSNDIDQAGKDPNVGKELTAEDKEALSISGGGSATGTPNGWEPNDENKSKEPQKNTQVQKLNQKQESAVRKIDNAIEKAMKDHDIMGTLKDMDGNPVAKPNGGYWDHMQEMNNTFRGLRNNAETQAVYNRAIQAIDKIESSIKGYGI
ncbi:polymorphic toxin type 28 domain-containing protein [Providencia manganoxydans]|uniref:polymorphic toxin type 28 domain-containing protein n=1 Tax=Providencia manganoxydans TaxID=2923283 RepID=UPI0034DD1043